MPRSRDTTTEQVENEPKTMPPVSKMVAKSRIAIIAIAKIIVRKNFPTIIIIII